MSSDEVQIPGLDNAPSDQAGRPEPDSSWKNNEEQAIPKNNLFVVVLGLAACTFLAALDQVRRGCLLIHCCFSHASKDDRCNRSTSYRLGPWGRQEL